VPLFSAEPVRKVFNEEAEHLPKSEMLSLTFEPSEQAKRPFTAFLRLSQELFGNQSSVLRTDRSRVLVESGKFGNSFKLLGCKIEGMIGNEKGKKFPAVGREKWLIPEEPTPKMRPKNQ
jgi:hypothetical protein